MALVLTRKAGEAVVFRRREASGEMRQGRVYVVAIEGNHVRLAFETLSDVEIVREELLDTRRTYRRWRDALAAFLMLPFLS